MEIPAEVLREILLKLPTKDVCRSCCVSRLWCSVLRDPSFRKLHHDNHADHTPPPGALLVATNSVAECSLVTVFSALLVSSSATTCTPMCRVANLRGYSLTGICNGLLCFTARGAPAVLVCNPVTGDKLALPKAPPLGSELHQVSFALGYSPTTGEYKLLRFACPASSEMTNVIHVYTLAGDASARNGWRQHPLLFPYRPVQADCHRSPPVVVGGKICVVTTGESELDRPGAVLVVDVASEAHRTYSAPYYGYSWAEAVASAFELHGRLCLAVNVLDWPHPVLQFWAMPLRPVEDDQRPWELLYKFDVDVEDISAGYPAYKKLPRAAWLDGETNTLCYRLGDCLYCRCVIDTTTRSSRRPFPTEVLAWDRKVHLPAAPSPSSNSNGWDIYGGYRPSLLSPLTFASQDHHHDDDDDDDENGQFVRSLLGALRRQKSPKLRPSPTLTGRTNAKRICSRTT